MQTGNVEVRQRSDGWLKQFLVWLHLEWMRLRSVVAVLSIVRFSLLVPAILALTLVMADQMIDLLRAVGEDGEVGTWISLLIMTSFAALIVWYSARTMLRFRFVSNSASDPLIHPGLKRILPRVLGISIPAMLVLRVAFLAPESSAPRGVVADGRTEHHHTRCCILCNQAPSHRRALPSIGARLVGSA